MYFAIFTSNIFWSYLLLMLLWPPVNSRPNSMVSTSTTTEMIIIATINSFFLLIEPGTHICSTWWYEVFQQCLPEKSKKQVEPC